MHGMKSTVAEQRLVVILFVLVLITFSFAHRDSKRLERLYTWTLQKKTDATAVKTETPILQPVK